MILKRATGYGEFLQRERSAGSINDCAKVCDFAGISLRAACW